MTRESYTVRTAVLRGVEALPVMVEVHVAQGMPGITIVGMAESTVQEAKQRVRCAIKGCGYDWPRANITVNLAPGEVRKVGTGFDLPIAVAILACTAQIPTRGLDSCLLAGELALDGEVSAVRGLVAFGMLARDQGLTFVGPPGISSHGEPESRVIRALAQLRAGVQSLQVATAQPACSDAQAYALDFADVIDQEIAKRAFVIAASGNHGLLMVGPPGAGKSMMAKRMPTILSRLQGSEQLEAMLVHSAAGLDLSDLQRGCRPFRAPHHAITMAGLVGGGRPVIPGEVSLAHHGVLFLDELPEFGPTVLQSLRQPLEEHEVRLVRADGTYVFPCDFMLVAAANPCPCGYLGDADHACTCSPARVQAYQARIGGPLLDRIDVRVDVARPASARIIAGERGTSSQVMAEQVRRARAFASWRLARSGGAAEAQATTVPQLGFDAQACSSLEESARCLALGGRNIVRIARVARTIADLDESEQVRRAHVIEACAFRTRTQL